MNKENLMPKPLAKPLTKPAKRVLTVQKSDMTMKGTNQIGQGTSITSGQESES